MSGDYHESDLFAFLEKDLRKDVDLGLVDDYTALRDYNQHVIEDFNPETDNTKTLKLVAELQIVDEYNASAIELRREMLSALGIPGYPDPLPQYDIAWQKGEKDTHRVVRIDRGSTPVPVFVYTYYDKKSIPTRVELLQSDQVERTIKRVKRDARQFHIDTIWARIYDKTEVEALDSELTYDDKLTQLEEYCRAFGLDPKSAYDTDKLSRRRRKYVRSLLPIVSQPSEQKQQKYAEKYATYLGAAVSHPLADLFKQPGLEGSERVKRTRALAERAYRVKHMYLASTALISTVIVSAGLGAGELTGHTLETFLDFENNTMDHTFGVLGLLAVGSFVGKKFRRLVKHKVEPIKFDVLNKDHGIAAQMTQETTTANEYGNKLREWFKEF